MGPRGAPLFLYLFVTECLNISVWERRGGPFPDSWVHSSATPPFCPLVYPPPPSPSTSTGQFRLGVGPPGLILFLGLYFIFRGVPLFFFPHPFPARLAVFCLHKAYGTALSGRFPLTSDKPLISSHLHHHHVTLIILFTEKAIE